MGYDPNPAGCYGDGTFGHAHVRERLAELLAAHGGPQDLADELRGPMSDDAAEEDHALAWINDRLPDGYVAGFDGGDLLILPAREWE